jgi:hypothetical protein
VCLRARPEQLLDPEVKPTPVRQRARPRPAGKREWLLQFREAERSGEVSSTRPLLPAARHHELHVVQAVYYLPPPAKGFPVA